MSERMVEIVERTIESQWIAGIRFKGKYAEVGPVFGRLGKLVGRYIAGKAFCLYYDGDYREDDADIEACFPIRKQIEVDEAEVRELPGARCATLTHHGPYENLGQSYAIIMRHAKDKGYEIALPTREIYIKGPGMIFKGNPKKYVTEIQLPIQD